MAISKENKVLRDKAVGLRKEGLSLLEIMKDIPRPKGTVYHWIKDVELTKIQKARLDKNSKDILLASQKMATEAMCKKYETICREWFEKKAKIILMVSMLSPKTLLRQSVFIGERGVKPTTSVSPTETQVFSLFLKNFYLKG